MVLKDKSGVRFVTLNSTLTKIDSQKPLPFVALTAPECSGVYIYEDAKENVALERCTDVITNMIIYQHYYRTEDELYTAVEECAYVQYNHVRPHSYNNYKTPYEARHGVT